MERQRCDYCWRPSIATILLGRGPIGTMLDLERRKRYVCADHLKRDSRPHGRHG